MKYDEQVSVSLYKHKKGMNYVKLVTMISL
jgi:hypothetical protein